MIRDARNVLYNEGLKTLVHAGVWLVYCKTVRQLMPITEPDIRVIDDVKFSNHTKRLRRFGDEVLRFREDTYIQDGEVNAHLSFTNEGDQVAIIGGGRGTTAVHAAGQVGDDGSVTVYEGGNISSLIREVVELNEVEDVVEVVQAMVGSARKLYGGVADDTEIIQPADLPMFDVLEMDCEGSELGILQGMEIRPRLLIVETHPHLYDENNTLPIELIEEMGYEIRYCSTRFGKVISEEAFRKRLDDGHNDVLAAIHTGQEQGQDDGEL
jgi:hypothetical protein